MFGSDAFMPTLFKLLLPKFGYMGDDRCKIDLDTMREIYMMVVLNLKIARDKYPPLTCDPDNTDIKVGNMVLLKNHA